MATCYDDVFTTFHADIPDGKWFLQETLLRCAGLGASVQLSGQKLWRFRGIYHQQTPTPALAGVSNHVPGLFFSLTNLPMNKSPPQSPHVVMPSHHLLVYLL